MIAQIIAQISASPPLLLAQVASETPLSIVHAEGWERWVILLSNIATIFLALGVIAIALALIALARQSRKIYGQVGKLLDRLHEGVQPIVGHATDVAENVNYMSTAVRSDVDRLRGTLEEVQERVTRVGGVTEEKIRRFNALLDVVQDEAEDLFVETASTLRGVQEGARRLRGESKPRSARRGAVRAYPDTAADADARRRNT